MNRINVYIFFNNKIISRNTVQYNKPVDPSRLYSRYFKVELFARELLYFEWRITAVNILSDHIDITVFKTMIGLHVFARKRSEWLWFQHVTLTVQRLNYLYVLFVNQRVGPTRYDEQRHSCVR